MKNLLLRNLFLLSVFLFAFQLLAGCTQENKPREEIQASLGKEFTLFASQNATIEGTNMRIGFSKVLEDSRCPSDVTCFWQGEALVLLQVFYAHGTSSSFTLAQGQGSGARLVGPYIIKLLSLSPQPKSGRQIRSSEYYGNFIISKASQRDIFELGISGKCSIDSDCALVNRYLEFRCCWGGACDSIDYSKPNWVAVNSAWFNSNRERNCPKSGDCGPAPLCPIKLVNNNYDARCVEGSCSKVARSKYEYYTFEWADGFCGTKDECAGIQYGCGFDHVVCTNDSAKWRNTNSTCEVISEHPVKEGYRCSCVISEKKCAWVK